MTAAIHVDDEKACPHGVGIILASLECASQTLAVRRPAHRRNMRISDRPRREEYTTGPIFNVCQQQRPSISHRLERTCDPFSIRRPDGRAFISGLVGDQPLCRSIDVHQTDVIGALANGLEHDSLAVGLCRIGPGPFPKTCPSEISIRDLRLGGGYW